MVERGQPGVRQVALVAAAAAAVVFGAAVVTGLLPDSIQRVIFHAPLTILVLIVGTSFVLWRVATHRPPES
ncbi:MAG: hypothetical protein EPO00_09455 [Chloroflexota bacterium]|nr:MAG: hypothetical protein EPO00_09455 [Chloroflexota bacterium]